MLRFVRGFIDRVLRQFIYEELKTIYEQLSYVLYCGGTETFSWTILKFRIAWIGFVLSIFEALGFVVVSDGVKEKHH